MIALRAAKATTVAAIALFASLVTFGNLTDYNTNFAFVEHRGEFPLLRWNDGNAPAGSFGNLVFLHDRALASLLPDVLECASALALHAVAVGEMYAEAAVERMVHIEHLTAQLRTQS